MSGAALVVEVLADGGIRVTTPAVNGLPAQVTDLLDRGVSPDVGRRSQTPYRLAMQRGHIAVRRSAVVPLAPSGTGAG